MKPRRPKDYDANQPGAARRRSWADGARRAPARPQVAGLTRIKEWREKRGSTAARRKHRRASRLRRRREGQRDGFERKWTGAVAPFGMARGVRRVGGAVAARLPRRPYRRAGGPRARRRARARPRSAVPAFGRTGRCGRRKLRAAPDRRGLPGLRRLRLPGDAGRADRSRRGLARARRAHRGPRRHLCRAVARRSALGQRARTSFLPRFVIANPAFRGDVR